MSNNTIADTLDWFKKAIPEPTSKNIHTQLGVHFEEVGEMIMTLRSDDWLTRHILETTLKSINDLASHLKKNDNVITIDEDVRIDFLDSLADQAVTLVGCANNSKLDIVGALNEVNRSNFSKFDEQGNPIFNENLKIIKGPNYSPPDLSSFV